MTTARIEDVAEPTVGEYYMVPTVYSERWNCRIPIYGPMHEDREFIDFDEQHWHIDWRFVTKRFYQWKLWTRKNNDPRKIHGVVTSKNRVAFDAPKTTRLRMKREMPPYPEGKDVPWLKKMEEAFANRTLPKCRTCPHPGDFPEKY